MAKKHDIIWLDSIDSTNEEAKRHISDIDNLSVLSAWEQTAGRGQRGNTWTSNAGENLMFSIVLKSPALMAEDHFALNEIAALSVSEFLSTYGIKAQIKWPNDIYVDEKKICGILIENSFRGKSISSSIIGIGLNINQRNFNVTLPNPTSVLLECGEIKDIRKALIDFMRICRRNWMNHIASSLSHEYLHRRYLDLLWRKDLPFPYVDNIRDVRFTGIIRGIDSFGRLSVETEKGELREFAFKEISYII
mgnify:CR=1 FL=1